MLPVASNVYTISSLPTKEDFTTQSHLDLYSPSAGQTCTREPQTPSSFCQSHPNEPIQSLKISEAPKYSLSSSFQSTLSTEERLHSHKEKENKQSINTGTRKKEKHEQKSTPLSQKKKYDRYDFFRINSLCFQACNS